MITWGAMLLSPFHPFHQTVSMKPSTRKLVVVVWANSLQWEMWTSPIYHPLSTGDTLGNRNSLFLCGFFFIHSYLRFAFTAAWLYVLLLVVFLTRTYLTEYLLECYKEPFYDLYIEVSSIINILPDSFVQIRWSILLSTVIVCYLFDNVFYLHTTCCKNVLSGKDDI